MPDIEPRTLNEAMTDVRYACHYGELNERFWRRLDTTLNLVGAAGGSSAIAGALASNAVLGLAAGVALSIASTLQLVLRPGERAIAFRDARRAFLELHAKGWGLTVTEIDAARMRLEAEAPVGLRWLSMPAWNENVRSIGHEQQVRPLRWYERLAQFVA